ncbi:MAG: HAMP domain-containing histidine kinase [Lachnospiraceae bacterium]|nr:HAMP domain-containing histidine kinase [Lachnospiraceae bacterium]
MRKIRECFSGCVFSRFFIKIRGSLSFKVFLWVMTALTVCSLLIYGIVMFIIPKQYTALSDSRVDEEIRRLSEELEGMDRLAAKERISDFCRRNHAAAVLTFEEESFHFGTDFGGMDYAVGQEENYTVSVVLSLADVKRSFLTIVLSREAVGELNRAFLQIAPLVFALILLIAAISAWLCSRAIVQPVLKLAGVSKRMAQLDMTWRCEEERTDELGVLGKSLNTLAFRLTGALSELEGSNEKLRQEIATVNAMERQRRDFFAAASHELKTPVTILKGQMESMILGIGKYRDVKSILPETYAEVERMEALVRELLGIVKLEMRMDGKEMGRIAVHKELREVISGLSVLAKEKGTVISCKMEEVFLQGNPALFGKALHNIVGNAIRHSPEESKVFICLTGECLTVKNTGILLPEEEMGKLFAPFYRVEKSRNSSTGGSGLGLYLVKRIFELHGVDFSLKNGEGGVVFTVYFGKNCEEGI